MGITRTGGIHKYKHPAGLYACQRVGYRFKDDTFTKYQHDKVIEEGKFRVIKKSSTTQGKELKLQLIFNGRTDWPVPFTLNGNTLVLYHGDLAADGTISTYIAR